MSDSPLPVVSLQHAVKTFGPVVALADGSIDLYAGEIHALSGENGAGKSTIVKVLAGLYHRDSGEFLLNGSRVSFGSVADSKAAGVSVIYQEPTLFPDLTVAENIFVGRQPRGRFGMIDHRAMRDEAAKLFAELGVPIDPARSAEGLSIADQQIIEIAKAISMDAKVLIMDEPTAALSGHEVERLFTVARSIRDKGAALMFISHRTEEVFALCDRITVMRDGRYVTTRMISETTPAQVVRDMVGREIDQLFPKIPSKVGEAVLTVDKLNRDGVFRNVSFEVRSGEIVGLAGLVGAGRSEVARAIMGVDPVDSGSVTLLGKPLRLGDPSAAMKAGMGFVPEDRRKQGLVMNLSVLRNTTLTLRDELSRFGLISARREAEAAAEWTRKLQVKSATPQHSVSTLSGGNQQKVVLAKWLAREPRLLIVDEPTRGIDVGTKAEVHRLLSQLAADGIAILMISSELPEILGMADRVVVMCEGAVTGEFSRDEATPELVMAAATDHAKAAAA
ncbi:sugar ABC transporter ATP-binding protein [Tessaracoccus sp. Z1128]